MEIKLTHVFFSSTVMGIRKKLLKIIMRTFIFLLCTTVFGFTSGNVLSQTSKVNITENKTITVDEVFDIIKEQTNYRFIYKSDMFKDFPKVSVKKGIIKANRLLKQSLSKGNFNFNFSDKNTIIIRHTSDIQELEISGQVTDVNGIPLPGMTVYVTNRKPTGERMSSDFIIRGTATDFDGKFTLKAEEGFYLVVSGIGYEFSSQPVLSSQTVYNVVLKERASALDEILVVGYGTTRKRDLTGSVGSVDSEEIQQIKTQTIDQALVGKVTGVHVSANTGVPGSGAIVHIRGLSQIRGDNQPLYVVDGVPIVMNPQFSSDGLGIGVFGDRENPLLSINPNDVERVDVLKDASAAAIYGSRAANGVILITTKRGKKNQAPKFNFSYNTTIQNPTQKINYLNADQFKSFATTQAQSTLDTTTAPEFLWPFIFPSEYTIVNDPDSFFGTEDTDWQDLITNDNAFWNQYSFSTSGGTDRTNYFVSATVSNQEGVMIGNKFNRYNFSTNLDSQLNDRLKVGATINYNYSVNKISGINSLSNANFRPDQGVFNEDGTYTSRSQFGGAVIQRNPLGDGAKVRNKAISKNLTGSVYGELKLIENLKFRSQISIGVSNDESTEFSPSFTSAAQFNEFFSSFTGALLDTQNSDAVTTSFSNTLNYNATINEDHHIDAVVGASWDRFFNDLVGQNYIGFPDDEVLTGVGNALNVDSPSSASIENGLNSLFARVNYNYKDKYLLTFTGRQDTSTKFGPDNKRGFFPSGAFAWNLHNEDFLKNSEILNQLKLRVSLGRTGSDNLPGFTYLPYYVNLGNGDSFYDGVNGFSVDGVPNEGIKWESTDQLDLGVEFSLFNNRLNGEIVYFEKNTSGLILLSPIPSETGSSDWFSNVADVSNTGVEIALGGDIVRNENFRWNSSFNISFIDNNVDALNGGSQFSGGGLTGIEEGSPIGFILGYEVDRIAQTQLEIDDLNASAPNGTYYNSTSQPGDYIYKDLNGDGEITREGDRTNIGDINPDYYGGWNNTMSYKDFDLSFNFQFVQGNEREWTIPGSMGRVDLNNNYTDIIFDTWSPENTGAHYARIGTFGHFDTNTKSVVDGSYIRLRSASIGYSLPQKIIEKAGLSNARISISGNNLFTITDYPGQDPENVERQRGGSTIDLTRTSGFSYPQVRTFTFGVDLSF